MTKGKTGGGVGTNQFQVRGQARRAPSAGPNPGVDLMAQARTAPIRNQRSVSSDPWVRRNAAAETKDPQVLMNLSQDPSAQVRLKVALNPRTPPDAIGMLAYDDVPDIRGAAAGHPNIPPDQLAELSTSSEWGIRYHAARNPQCPPAVLDRLSHDGYAAAVRSAIAANPSTPHNTLQRLLADESPKVRAEVQKRTDLPEHLRTLAQSL